MAKMCPLCEKAGLKVGGYSNRVRATKYKHTGMNRKQPNLQWARLNDGSRIKICTRCLKKGKQLEISVIRPARRRKSPADTPRVSVTSKAAAQGTKTPQTLLI